ncbi:hypothetical protein G8C93_02960 [Cellulosimicrobium cellulans]|uniref:hypothetical protein n=1 Tax=Cellulosimicrobium cellulans TaxID=1710 RepID=UPI001883C512|nr:hypothetical protein [Cellulosimicrobium cellulans]MBE9924852.1 hypothetical protein [Cellulosimicrobium cellulans]
MSEKDPQNVETGAAAEQEAGEQEAGEQEAEEQEADESGQGRYWSIELGRWALGLSVLSLVATGVIIGMLMQRHVQTGIDWTHLGSVISNFGPAATVTAAIVALIVGLLAWWQKRTADARDQFWKRLQWTLDKVYSEKPREQRMGSHMLAAIAKDRHAQRVEDKIIAAATDRELDRVPTKNPAKEIYRYVGEESGSEGGSE